jgi:hypothetical protein
MVFGHVLLLLLSRGSELPRLPTFAALLHGANA